MFPHDSPIFPLFLIECSPEGRERDGKLSFDFTIDRTIRCHRKISLIFPYPPSFRLLYFSSFFFVSQLYTRYFDSPRINRVSSNLMIFDHSISVVIQLEETLSFDELILIRTCFYIWKYLASWEGEFFDRSKGKVSNNSRLRFNFNFFFLLRSFIFIFSNSNKSNLRLNNIKV